MDRQVWEPQIWDGRIQTLLMASDAERLDGQIVAAVLRDGRWSGDLTLRHLTTQAAIHVTAGFFLVADGTAAGKNTLAVIAQDVSAQIRLEGMVRQSQTMEAVSQLTSGIAHDFNNMLTGIMGALQLMEVRQRQGRFDKFECYLSAATASAARAAAMTQQLLAFSSRQPLNLVRVDADALIAGAADRLRRAAGPAVRLHIDGAGDAWPTLCDAAQLETVLVNLVLNGRDAMPDGGWLEVMCRNLDLSDVEAARQRNIEPGQYLAILVSDSGCGMAPETVARAFEPFFTTKGIGRGSGAHGSGLGLSMVYGFARQSGGQVQLSSSVGVGTTASLYLPRLREAIAPSTPAVPHREVRPGAHGLDGREIVLVVDDEVSIRALVTEILADMGFATIEAADGLEGLRMIQSDARIDLLVTDVGLPGMDGRRMVEAARARRPELKVLFMTGYAENPLFERREAEASIRMMTKPFAIATLEAAVREIMTSRE